MTKDASADDRAAARRTARGTGAKRGAYAKSADRRTEILDAALEVFGRTGYRSGSINEVAEKVGMSEPGLLHHFTSKRALLTAVLERRDTLGAERAQALHGADLLLGLVVQAADNARHRGIVQLYTVVAGEATSAEHPAHEYFTGRYHSFAAIVRRALEEVEAVGGLAADASVTDETATIIAIMDGLQVQWLLDPEAVDMPEVLEAQIATIVDPEVWARAKQDRAARVDAAAGALGTGAPDTAEAPGTSGATGTSGASGTSDLLSG
ncbi:hypothetical protein GCM10009839_25250 [Catenulispora yoronensis]|uniref:HTH tetR-type domain-containing protein n=1 Tax=Catenulispora yoronensis TaxID=450799 RepID=A0ABN2U046_9ACTN